MSAVPGDARETSSGSVAWIYAGTATFFLSGGAFYLYLARILPTGELGSVVVLGAIASLVSIAAALGLGGGLQHFLAFYRGRSEQANTRTLLRSAFALAALLSLLATGVLVVLADPLSHFFFHSGQYTATLEFLGLYAGLATAATILQSVLIGLQRFVAFSLAYILSSVATYGLPVLLLHFWPDARSVVFGWALGAGIGVLVSATLVVRGARAALRPGPAEPGSLRARTLYRSVLLYSVPLLASTLVGTTASYVDRLVLASLANLPTVGVYNYAILVATGSLFVVAPFATVLVPRISASFGRHEVRAIRAVGRTAITLIVLVYVPLALGLAAVGPALLRSLVGNAFVAASGPMALLLGITAVSIPYAVLVSIASGIRRTPILLHASALALLSNVGLSVLLVRRVGMMGAAVGNASMYSIVLLVLYFELRSTDLVRFDLGSIARIWAASATMFAAIAVPLFLLGFPIKLVPVFLVIGGAVLLLALRLVRAIPGDVVDALIRFLPRWTSVVRPVLCWSAACERCHHRQAWSGAAPSLVAGPKDL